MTLREELIERVEEWWVSIENGQAPCYFTLRKDLDEFLVQARNEHRNPRVALLPDHTDETPQNGYDAGDLLGEKNLHRLDELRDALEEKSQLEEKAATVATALVAGHCARLDSNPQAADRVWQWVDNQSPPGLSPQESPVLRVIHFFAEASHRKKVTLDDLKTLANESHRQLETPAKDSDSEVSDHDKSSEDKRKEELYQPVLTHLTEVLSMFPIDALNDLDAPQESTDLSVSGWLDKIYRDNFDKSPYALFHQHYARILLRLNNIDKARKQADMALAHTKPHMLQSIEASRQLRLAIDLEDLSQNEIKKGVKDDVIPEVKAETEKIVDHVKIDINEIVENERDTTTKQIQDALLNIIEILGVFLAVVGVAVTAVGGIAVEGSFAVKIAVWGFGYGSIVSLFWLLRRITGGPSARAAWQTRRNSSQNSEGSAP